MVIIKFDHYLLFVSDNFEQKYYFGVKNLIVWSVRAKKWSNLQKFIKAIHYVSSFLKTILKHFGPGGQKNILWNMSGFVFLESRSHSHETFRYSVLSFLKDLRAPKGVQNDRKQQIMPDGSRYIKALSQLKNYGHGHLKVMNPAQLVT